MATSNGLPATGSRSERTAAGCPVLERRGSAQPGSYRAQLSRSRGPAASATGRVGVAARGRGLKKRSRQRSRNRASIAASPARRTWDQRNPVTRCTRRYATAGSSCSRRASSSRERSPDSASRSEEHTSELQSPVHIVCRLLLEKKKYRG